MNKPAARLPVPRPRPSQDYDRRVIEQSFQSLERDLQEKYDRRSDLVLPRGFNIVVSSDDGSAQYGLGVNSSGKFRLLDYSDGSIGTFAVAWEQVDGAAEQITTLTSYVDAQDASLQGSITTNASAITTNASAISGIQTELTAARQGEASLLANLQSIQTAYADADTAIAADVTTLTARVTANEGDISVAQADIGSNTGAIATNDSAIGSIETEITAARDGEASLLANINDVRTAFAAADSALSTSISTVSAQIRGGSNLLSYARFDDVAAAGDANIDPRGWDGRPNNSGMTGASVGVTGSSVASGNQPPGLRCIRFFQPSGQSSGNSDAIYYGRNSDYKEIPCIPGQRYCASAYVNAQNASEMRVTLNFRDASGNFVSLGDNQDNTNYSSTVSLGAGNNLANYERIWAFAEAPSTARFVTMGIQKYPNASGNQSFGFAALPQIEEAAADQENPSPWSDGIRSADVTVLREAFVDSNGESYAGIRLVAAASGSDPAIVELTSGDGAANVRIGGNTQIDGDVIIEGGLSVTAYKAQQNATAAYRRLTVGTSATSLGDVDITARGNPMEVRVSGQIKLTRASGTAGTLQCDISVEQNGIAYERADIIQLPVAVGETFILPFFVEGRITASGSGTDNLEVFVTKTDGGTNGVIEIEKANFTVIERVQAHQFDDLGTLNGTLITI